MKRILSFIVLGVSFSQLFGQQIAVSPDKNNVFYIGVDNPITVTAENCSCNDLVVKASNGTLIGKGCQYLFRGIEPGRADITVYKKRGNKLKEIGNNAFRVKRLPLPVFKIGPYGGGYDLNNERKVQKIVIANQQFVRAELENFDIDIKYSIDSFSVRIFYNDSAKVKTFLNTSNKISQELSDGLSVLKKDDIVVFHNIFIIGPDRRRYEINPLVLTIFK